MHKIAKKACFSYERFRHVFKEQTGVSPHKYLNDKRVELATFLMEIYPGVSVSSIAKECGFSGVSQFSNAFKAKMGCSPMDYKQKLKNNPSNGT
jgi:AraC family transcriptional activator of pobA